MPSCLFVTFGFGALLMRITTGRRSFSWRAFLFHRVEGGAQHAGESTTAPRGRREVGALANSNSRGPLVWIFPGAKP